MPTKPTPAVLGLLSAAESTAAVSGTRAEGRAARAQRVMFGFGSVSVEKQLFNLKFTAKQMDKMASKTTKKEREEVRDRMPALSCWPPPPVL